ncbi:DUF4355 domain-containing protein [Paraliobacillus sp. X-1268]|uniref:DUF4355 domain-containing protein n=1 Tax=Paraliobacillus sp. X-1268 TaxID=2213193 RepID=UPI000E3CC871|nr:DUF4355 domain-containing protein [Paraliobacillus sp. X-1268]
MNLEEIKQYLESNKENEEVKAYIEGLSSVTPDGVTNYLETEEGKKLLQPKLDSYFNKGLETFKQKSMPKLIDEEIKTRFPEKDEKDIELEKIRSELQTIRSEKQRESLTNKAIKLANEQKLPIDLVDYFIGEDEDKTTQNLTKLKEVFDTHLQSAVDEKLKAGGTNLQGGTQPKTFTREQISSMSHQEVSENWEAVQESLKSSK